MEDLESQPQDTAEAEASHEAVHEIPVPEETAMQDGGDVEVAQEHPEPEESEETAPGEPNPGPQTISIEEWMASSQPVAEEEPEPAALEDVQLLAVLEACVYVAEEPLMPAQIAAALNQDPERIRTLLQRLMAEFERPEHGVSIKEVAGGYKMATKAEHHEAVRSFVKSLKAPLKLSLPALETLAVVAYKQPVTSPEIMDIRGVQGGGVLKTLLDRKLITEAGRKNVIGKPILYKTTKEFLIQFGLKDLSELPTLKEFEEIRRMSMADSESPSETTVDAPETEAAAPGLAAVVGAAEVTASEPEASAPAVEVAAPESTAAETTEHAPEAEAAAPSAPAVTVEVPLETSAHEPEVSKSATESAVAETPEHAPEAAAPEAAGANVESPLEGPANEPDASESATESTVAETPEHAPEAAAPEAAGANVEATTPESPATETHQTEASAESQEK